MVGSILLTPQRIDGSSLGYLRGLSSPLRAMQVTTHRSSWFGFRIAPPRFPMTRCGSMQSAGLGWQWQRESNPVHREGERWPCQPRKDGGVAAHRRRKKQASNHARTIPMGCKAVSGWSERHPSIIQKEAMQERRYGQCFALATLPTSNYSRRRSALHPDPPESKELW